MEYAFENVQSQLLDVIDCAMSTAGNQLRLGLISFGHITGDYVQVHYPLTYDITAVKNSIAGFTCDTSGGIPEASSEALKEMLYVAVPDSTGADCLEPPSDRFNIPFQTDPTCAKIAVLITDAPPGECNDLFTWTPDALQAHLRATEAAASDIKIAALYVPTSQNMAYHSLIEHIMTDYAQMTNGKYVEVDEDGTGIVEALSPMLCSDCDENGIKDLCENHGDCNDNLISDICETYLDCNINNIRDICDIANGTSQDCNHNEIPDDCDISSNHSLDCNDNDIPDECDISSGFSQDCNENHVPDDCETPPFDCDPCDDNRRYDIAHAYAGTQGPGKVFMYLGDGQGQSVFDWEDLTPDGFGTGTVREPVAAVMDLAWYNGHLYAGVQSMDGYGGGSGKGQVWRHDTGTDWTKVFEKSTEPENNTSVMVLEVVQGKLYVGTTGNGSNPYGDCLANKVGRLYRCQECNNNDWEGPLGTVQYYGCGFRAGTVSSICGTPMLYLGDIRHDWFYRYDQNPEVETFAGLGFYWGGSCIWDIAEFRYGEDQYPLLFAGGWRGPSMEYTGRIFSMPQDYCDAVIPDDTVQAFENILEAWTGDQNWAVESFKGRLYVGSGDNAAGYHGGKLRSSDGGQWPWVLERTWPTTIQGEGVTALANQGDKYLYIGLGNPAGGESGTGNGRAEVWRYEGTYYRRISATDAFGGGVQCLLVTGASTDCDGNGIRDECQDPPLADCNHNLVPDLCEPQENCNSNAVQDICDITNGSTDCNKDGIPDECLGGGDCNSNGNTDACDIWERIINIEETRRDCNENIIPDECEPDCNGNGTPDDCDLAQGGDECNHNGILDVCETSTILYVDDDVLVRGDGQSWNTAYQRLEDALLSAGCLAYPQEIHVAGGTYRPALSNGARTNSFALPSSKPVLGGYAGLSVPKGQRDNRNPRQYVSILSGDLNEDDTIGDFNNNRDDNVYHVVYCQTDGTLDGFTISGGHANGEGEDEIPRRGGGLCVNMDAFFITVTNCIFMDNYASGDPNGEGGGAGIYASPTAGMAVANCIFSGNVAPANGGGILTYASTNSPIESCVFTGNGAGHGGGLYVNIMENSVALPLRNCTFSGNSATHSGKAVYYEYTNPNASIGNMIIRNCILWNENVSGTHEIVMNNSPGNPAVTLDVDFSDVCGGQSGISLGWNCNLTWGGNNKNESPAFMDFKGPDQTLGTADDDLRLQAGSPCVDTGNNAGIAPDAKDLDGRNRIINDTVDMGAYELRVWYVDVNLTGGMDDGSAWWHSFHTIDNNQHGPLARAFINPAIVNGDQIWVANGLYKPTESQDRNTSFFLVNGVRSYGGFQGITGGSGETQLDDRNVLANETILSGDIGTSNDSSDNSYHIVVGSGTGSSTILDGFVITQGNADGSDPHDRGAGVYNSNGGPTIRNCRFIDNHAAEGGGGMYNHLLSHPILVNCLLRDNAALTKGGGIWNNGGSPKLTNCVLACNQATGTGSLGGGLYVAVGGTPAVTNSIVYDNLDDVNDTDVGAQIYEETAGTATVSYSCIGDTTPGATPYPFGGSGNHNTDKPPLWDGDFRPRGPLSPCTDAGNNGAPSLPETDMAGHPRIHNSTVDIGVYERYEPIITSAVSSKQHGSVGSFDVNLLTSLVSTVDVPVEGRIHGPTTVVVTFSEAVQGIGGLDNTDVQLVGTGSAQGTVTNVLINGNTLTITIGSDSVSDGSRLSIAFPGIADLVGHVVTDSLCMGVLYGDATGDGKTNVLDLLVIKPQVNQPVTTGNFRCDVNADGSINVLDLLATKNNLNHAITNTCPGGCLAGGGQGEGFAGGSNKSGQSDQLSLKISGTELVNGNISVALHPHGTNAAEIKLPAEGGTILVDLVISGGIPIAAFEGRLVADMPNLVNVISSDWNPLNNILASYALAKPAISSSFNMTIMDWYVQTKDGTWVPGTDDGVNLETPAANVLTLTSNLTDLDGPVGTYKDLVASQGHRIGGIMAPSKFDSGDRVVATLSLRIADTKGVYSLGLMDAQAISVGGTSLPIEVCKPLEIRVGGD